MVGIDIISIEYLIKKTISDIANGTNDETVRLPSHFKNVPWITINLNYLNQNHLKLLKHSR